MPKVEQLDWNKLIPSHKEKPIKPLITLKVKSKKKKKDIQRIPFFTCSKCKVNTESRKNLKEHWLLEH